MKKIVLFTCSFILIFTAGCGPSSEMLAVTMVAQTDVAVTQTLVAVPSNTPTETDTPIPTETPVPSTPTQLLSTLTQSSQLKSYYPIEPNTVWWYLVSTEGREPGGMTSFTLLPPELYEDGSQVYTVVNRNFLPEDVSEFVMYYRILNNTVELVHSSTTLKAIDSALPETSDVEFTPPLPNVKFPLEVGNTWKRTGKSGQVTTYEVISLEDISVPYGDFEDCYMIERSTEARRISGRCTALRWERFSLNKTIGVRGCNIRWSN